MQVAEKLDWKGLTQGRYFMKKIMTAGIAPKFLISA
jgi:hypothetical protein